MNDVVALTESDAGELLTLQRGAYVTEAQAHDDPRLPPLVETLDDLRSALTDPAVTTLGIRDTTARLVASVRLTLRTGEGWAELGRLMVAPDLQGRDLGGRLLDVVDDHLPARVVGVRLFTGERSPANLRLYARHGYEETGREQTPAGYAVVHLVKRLR